SRTRFSPETWYGNETIYSAGTQYTNARTKHHGRGTEPLFGTGLRSDVRLRGDRLRAQADGPAQPPFRAQAVQRTAGGDRDLPELPREDAEGARGGRDRGAEGPPGSARGGRVPPVAERAGPVRGDPRPGGLDDARRGRPDPCGSAAVRDGARQRARLYGRKWPSGCEGESHRRPERCRPEPPAAGEPVDPLRSHRAGARAGLGATFQLVLSTRARPGLPGAGRDPAAARD